MQPSSIPAPNLYEVPVESPVAKMQARMLRHKRKVFNSDSVKLNEEDLEKAKMISNIENAEEHMDALLEWAAELTDTIRKEQISASTRTEVKLRTKVAELEEKVTKDPLTGSYNRRYLEQQLPTELKKVERSRFGLRKAEEEFEKIAQERGYHENSVEYMMLYSDMMEKETGKRVELSLLFIDIDHFKPINDELGHKIGDEAIKGLTTILNDVLRDEDTIVRWGGEEFIVMMEATKENAEIVAEKIRAAVKKELKKLLEPHCKTPLQKEILAQKIAGTVSIGVASGRPEDDEIEATDLIAMADAAQYRAKGESRNTVRVYDPQLDRERVAESKKKIS